MMRDYDHTGKEPRLHLGIADGETEVSIYDYLDRKDIQSVSFPDSVYYIGPFAFAGCTNLKSVRFGKGLRTIEKESFADCTSLSSVTIPEGVTEIGEHAFGFRIEEYRPYEGLGYYSSYYTCKRFYQIEGFTIRGKKGSEAERYAIWNDLRFEEV